MGSLSRDKKLLKQLKGMGEDYYTVLERANIEDVLRDVPCIGQSLRMCDC